MLPLNRNRINQLYKNLPFLFLLIVSGIYVAKILLLSYPLVINTYPYISSDGFDWLTEGFWLAQTTLGENVSDVALPIARPPVFVFITFLDALLGQNAYIISLAFGVSFLGTGYYAVKSLGSNIDPLLSLVFLFALLFSPVNFVRKWMLSDSVCVFLSLAAVYYLFVLYRNSFNSLFQMIVLSFAIAVSGATQTYGLVAPLISIGFLSILTIKERNFFLLGRLVGVFSLALLIFFLFLFFWYGFIPHTSTPVTFGLLNFSSFAMARFYFHLWVYYFFPFTPLLMLVFWVDGNAFFEDPLLISLWLSVIAFFVLTFFYQWPESRFTFMYWHFFVIAVFKTYLYVDNRKHQFNRAFFLGFASALIIFQGLFLSTNEWQPNLREINVRPNASWFVGFLQASPLDRFELQKNCGAQYKMCADMVVSENFDVYVQNTVNAYMKILDLSFP
jgi:hypothetical protein